MWDLIVTEHDLAIATHGRGFYILDNIEPLRQYNPAMAASADPVLFAPSPAIRSGGAGDDSVLAQAAGAERPHRHSRREGAGRSHVSRHGERRRVAGGRSTAAARRADSGRGAAAAVAVAVADAVDSAAGGADRGRAGLNTFTWDGATRRRDDVPRHDSLGRHRRTARRRAPGKYTVRLTVDGKTVTQPLVVKRNPLHEATDADLIAQYALALQIRDKVSEANSAVVQIRDIKTPGRPTASGKSQRRQAQDGRATS